MLLSIKTVRKESATGPLTWEQGCDPQAQEQEVVSAGNNWPSSASSHTQVRMSC